MYLKTLVIVLASLHFATCETYEKVNFTYIYQALCPYCLQFVDQQFYSGYKQLSDYINLELIPAIHVVDTGITCNHGENECFISEAQACVFERPGITEALRVEYLYCTEAPAVKGKAVVDADIEACVNSILKDVVSYETVKTCMDNDESFPILTEYRARLDAYGVQFVPWIALFGAFDEAEEQQIRSNFVQAICAKLSNPPDVCKSSGRTYL